LRFRGVFTKTGLKRTFYPRDKHREKALPECFLSWAGWASEEFYLNVKHGILSVVNHQVLRPAVDKKAKILYITGA
jgi:hypothetical protein